MFKLNAFSKKVLCYFVNKTKYLAKNNYKQRLTLCLRKYYICSFGINEIHTIIRSVVLKYFSNSPLFLPYLDIIKRRIW